MMKKTFFAATAVAALLLGLLSVNIVHAGSSGSTEQIAAPNGLPLPNQPQYKYVSGVTRYGSTNATFRWVDTPGKVYYNDGYYTGYLYRQSNSFEHNFSNGTDRWVSTYAGNVLSVRYGTITQSVKLIQ